MYRTQLAETGSGPDIASTTLGLSRVGPLSLVEPCLCLQKKFATSPLNNIRYLDGLLGEEGSGGVVAA
jgi:hypothetical protein